MIGIIGALDTEVKDLTNLLEDKKEKVISGLTFYYGKIYDKEVVVSKCGMGKVFAAVCAEAMILNFDIEEIVHIGIAGSLDDELNIRDVAIADIVVQHDIDTTALGEPVGYIFDLKRVEIPCAKRIVEKLADSAKKLNIKYKVGVIASGDQFIADEEQKKRIVKNFSAIACEMEGASTGQVCFMNNVDFGVVRAFSDAGSEGAGKTYFEEKFKASDVAVEIIKEYLKC